MKKRYFFVILLLLGFCSASYLFAGEKAHWGYTGKEGPKFWGDLAPEFTPCKNGKNQSPVNLTGMIEGKLMPLIVKYETGGNEVFNNGHTIQVNYSAGSFIIIDGKKFELKQFHFHSPSENIIEGLPYPMEAHFVHADKDGNLAVIALMYNEGSKNNELEKAWEMMPEKAGETMALNQKIDAGALLPKDHSYYRFNGSLTTPPCTEGVFWIVMKKMSYVSKGQIKKFIDVMEHPNNRPVQPVNARMILK